MEHELVFLDTVLLQQDMRVRLPKSVLMNTKYEPGKTRLEVYINALTKEIVLKSGGSDGLRKGKAF